MTQWIEVQDGRRWEVVPVTHLSTYQMARACREVGMSPETIDEALSTPGHPDALLAFTVVLYAARLASGERGLRSVEQANDLPYGEWDIVDDEDEDEDEAPAEPDPTAAPAETEGAEVAVAP